MHARKTQRINEGFFDKHQSHPYQGSKYSKRDYDRESRSSNYRDRESPIPVGSCVSGTLLHNGSFRSQSREMESPKRHELRERDRSNYVQKVRDRERDVYKKDKYSEKRARRADRDLEHRIGHERIDRRSKLCLVNKHFNSDDRERDAREIKRDRNINDRDRNEKEKNERERERERCDRDRDRERDRNDRHVERIVRIGDWSEHVSSSGKMYYYNCKTEVSQWEKPKEWLEKERSACKDQHREKDHREKEREKLEKDDRYARFSGGFIKHSNAREESKQRWQCENESSNKRHEDNHDIEISGGDSTPTSEANYCLSGLSNNMTETNMPSGNSNQQSTEISGAFVNVLPKVSSHPPINTSSLLHISQNQKAAGNITGGNNLTTNRIKTNSTVAQPPITNLSPKIHQHQHPQTHPHLHQVQHLNIKPGSATPSSNSENFLDLNASVLQGKTSSSSNNTKFLELHDGPQKNLSKIVQHHGINSISSGSETTTLNTLDSTNNSNSTNIRDNPVNTTLYNLSNGESPQATQTAFNSCSNNNSIGSQYSCNPGYILKANEISTNSSQGQFLSTAGSCLATISIFTNISNDISGKSTSNTGPPTPTQEQEVTNSLEQRKTEATSASLSSLNSCVTSCVSSVAGRSQGPEISPKLAKYFRHDLIAHVTNWPAELLEQQAHECSKETHSFGDIQCTRVSAELKCARSLVRITEIQATLQEQKIMYLRQQIKRLEELKSHNSFMSDDI